MRSMVFECLDNCLCFSLSSRTSPLWKHSVLFSVSLTRTAVCICKFNPRQHTSTIRSSKHRRQILFNCFLLLLWKISDQMISLDYYHPWSSFHISTCQFWAMKRCRLVSVVKLTTFLAPYEHVLITCCLSFQVFRGSVFCMCQHGDANSSPNWRY